MWYNIAPRGGIIICHTTVRVHRSDVECNCYSINIRHQIMHYTGITECICWTTQPLHVHVYNSQSSPHVSLPPSLSLPLSLSPLSLSLPPPPSPSLSLPPPLPPSLLQVLHSKPHEDDNDDGVISLPNANSNNNNGTSNNKPINTSVPHPLLWSHSSGGSRHGNPAPTHEQSRLAVINAGR